MTTLILAAVAASAVVAFPAVAQPDGPGPKVTPRQLELLAKVKWQDGPCDGKLGDVATVKVPAGYRFVPAAGAQAYMEFNGNPPDDDLLGVLEPAAENEQWLMTFEFQDIGYVKDDEKDKIDAAAIMDGLKAGTKEANRHRARMGVPPLEVVGWDQPPAYDAQTHRLTWAVRGQSQGQFVVNYNSRILGRGGVMSANLIVDPNDMAAVLPKYNDLLGGYKFNPGQTHADFRPGDRVAEYGLTALIAGGALAAAAKTGLLGKLLKPLIFVGVAVAAAVGKVFKGGKSRAG